MIFLILFAVVSCRKEKAVKAEGKINVISLIFPSYDFVRAIAGSKVNLIMLLPPGTESHSFEPSPKDILAIMESDLFIYPGGENSKWVDRILESGMVEKQTKIIKLVDIVETVEEENAEGMENHEHDHELHEHDSHNEDDHDGILSTDEHVWTSPINAKAIVIAISQALCNIDEPNADFYKQNAAAYIAQLDELDVSLSSIVDAAKRKTLVFADRFPFRYFADAYGLSYFAAFPSCYNETEPSAATVAFLINKVKTEKIPAVFYIELSNQKMADTISEATGAKNLLFHSAHNVTKKEFESGITYLDLQKNNIVNLKEALW